MTGRPVLPARREGEVAMFGVWRCRLAALCGLLWLAPAGAVSPDARPAAVTALPGDTGRVVRWVIERADHRGRPFAVVDKKSARIHVFEPSGVPVGARSVTSLLPAERTTPAGRFDTEPGRNDKGEAIVWFQYDAALAIHRLRPAPAHERRPQRLASSDPGERRITFGCVVVPVSFYEEVIMPTLGSRRGVVYVLPEEDPVETLLRQADMALRAP